jgi:Family of unknown function (DUF5955)
VSNDPTGQCARIIVRVPDSVPHSVSDSAEDPRVTGLRDAVVRLRHELAGHRVHPSDREVAENELAALYTAAAAGVLVIERLRGSLLALAGALGSVSALAPSLAEVRAAIDLFGPVPIPRSHSEATGDPG